MGEETYAKTDRPVDLQAAELLKKEHDSLIAELSWTLFRYRENLGYWCMWCDTQAKNAAQNVLMRIYVIKEDDGVMRPSFPFGSNAAVKNAVDQLKVLTTNGPLSGKAPPAVIVFKNGTFDLEAGELKSHSPSHGATYGVTADWIREAACPPELQKVISTCYPEGAEHIIRAMIRWAIDPTIRYGEAFHIIGGSGSGKGLIIDFTRSLFPAAVVSQLQHPADLASPEKVHQYVVGKRILAFPDTPAIYDGSCNIFYELVENKPVTTRKLYSGESDQGRQLHCRFILGSVKPLQFKDGRDGYIRRVITLQTLPRRGDPDTGLRDGLEPKGERYDAIRAEAMSWALAMPLDKVRQVLDRNDPEGLLRDAADQASVASDTVSQWADQCLAATEDADSTVSEQDWREMFDCYLQWCRDSNVSYTSQRNNFQGHLRTILGPARCLPRRKESRAEMRAAGRDKRVNIPASDHGFCLRPGIWSPTGFNATFMTAGGLSSIGALRPASGLRTDPGWSQDWSQDTPPAESPCAAVDPGDIGSWSQDTKDPSFYEAEEKQEGERGIEKENGAFGPGSVLRPPESPCNNWAACPETGGETTLRPWHPRAAELHAGGKQYNTIALQLEQEMGVIVSGRQVKEALG